jgi:hypothetical protein
MRLVQLLRNRGIIAENGGIRTLAIRDSEYCGIQCFRDLIRLNFLRFAAVQFVVFLLALTATVSVHGQATESGPHLYFFTNDVCAPCRQVEPEIESLRQAGYPVTTVNLSQSPDWGRTFSVDRTPTVILVSNQRIVGRHAGLIKAATLMQWFAAIGAGQAQNSQSVETRVSPTIDSKSIGNGIANDHKNEVLTYSELPDSIDKSRSGAPKTESFTARGTVHAGTNKPANALEAQAMNATVRLRVKDAEGISYATGTVIHSHEGEWLVMTCGHTFREAGFDGKITAEFNFLNGPVQSAEGELISYDAESRDVALVAVHAGQDIQPVKLANFSFPVDRGSNVFSIGCDGGAEPTIRHTEIKNKAIYSPGEASQTKPALGAVKYDIHGRPAIGRSGGGLFAETGELIGVCNAAAVESDEGIYSALDSLHWQITAANLGHLFDRSAIPESDKGNSEFGRDDRYASLEPPAPGSSQNLESPPGDHPAGNEPAARMQEVVLQNSDATDLSRAVDRGNLAADAGPYGADTEVVIIVRSKTAPDLEESITIEDPTPQLIQYLGEMKRGAQSRQVDMARVRKRTD